LTSTAVNPAITLIHPPEHSPKRVDLEQAGAAIHCPRLPREDDLHYHERLQGKWKAIRAVLEGFRDGK
jgi:hypothetical protein